uniref:Uncharacterized protein n=1 Tax=Heliothis virescens TaxID=7102 RepID=A0A2A4IRM0_HELVI
MKSRLMVIEFSCNPDIMISTEEESPEESKANGNGVTSECAAGDVTKREPNSERDDSAPDAAHIPPEFLSSESMSLSPSRLLHDAEGWLDGAVHDFSLSSFLGHLEGRPQVDSHLQSLMAESSVDYVAKFADLAAEVTDEQDHPPDEHT